MNNGFKTPEPSEQTQQKVEPVDDSFLEKPKTNTAIEIDNMLSDKSEQSAGSNFFVYILIFVVLAGVVMTYLVFQHKLSDTNSNVSTLSTKVNKINSSNSSINSSLAVTSFLVPNLGIQILVPSNYSDLTTATGSTTDFSNSSTQAIFLSSKNIAEKDNNCKSSSVAMGGAPLGIIAKIDGTYPPVGTVSAGVLLIQTKAYYLAYMPPATTCTTNKATLELINQYRFNLVFNSSTVSLSK
jgi:cell division protein FtsL